MNRANRKLWRRLLLAVVVAVGWMLSAVATRAEACHPLVAQQVLRVVHRQPVRRVGAFVLPPYGLRQPVRQTLRLGVAPLRAQPLRLHGLRLDGDGCGSLLLLR